MAEKRRERRRREGPERGEGTRSGEPAMEAVPGGSVRRVVFETEGRPVASRHVTERRYVPRHDASMREIEAEVDRIGHGRRRRIYELRPVEKDEERAERTVYRTERGSKVTDVTYEDGQRRHRVLYLRDSRDQPIEGRRFSHHMIDQVIKDVRLDEPAEHSDWEDAEAPKKLPAKASAPTGGSTKKAGTKGPKKRAGTTKSSAAPAKKKATKKRPAKKVRKKVTKKAAARPSPAAQAYQPQCEAVTHDGKQCRNSARKGAKYCGSHKGYRPQSLDRVLATKDTLPAHKKAKDTLPGSAKATGQGTAQCIALTAAGKQCRNSSRDGSKYCGSHKGYRGKTAIEKQMDTKPRVKKAKDTKPKLRK